MIRRLLLISFVLVAQLLDARSVLMEPRPAQVGFAEKVNAYVNSVHSKTPKDGIGQVLSKALFLSASSSMKGVTAILNELGPHLIRDKSVVEQEACSASLIKILVPIVSQFETALFKGIHTIEHSLEYWQFQELHPASYFFHKAPIKYFTFDQKKEVADKIQVLKKMREQHFVLLGKVNIHLSTFDAQMAVQDQYAWIQKLCRVLFAYDETLQVADDAEIFPLLYEATNIVPHYKTHMRERLKKYYMPNIFARRWMELTVGTSAVIYGGVYSYTHKEILGKYTKTGEEYWSYAKSAVFGVCDSEVSEQYKRYESKWSEEFLPRHEKVQDVQQKIATGVEKSDVVRAMMGAYLDIGVQGCRRVVESFAEIGHAFADGEKRAGIAERLAGFLVPATGSVRGGLGNAAAQLASPKRSNGRKEEVSSSSAAEEDELPFPVSESFYEVYNTGKLWAALQKDEHPHVWGLIRSAPFTVPLSIFAWKMSKTLYRRYTKLPNCESIRVALVDIALLLNVYGDAAPEEMDASDFGRLAYLAYKLEFDIGLVPKQYRESFLIEVGLLRTSSLNAQQKMKVIDLMYKKYPFLAFQGMITA